MLLLLPLLLLLRGRRLVLLVVERPLRRLLARHLLERIAHLHTKRRPEPALLAGRASRTGKSGIEIYERIVLHQCFHTFRLFKLHFRTLLFLLTRKT